MAIDKTDPFPNLRRPSPYGECEPKPTQAFRPLARPEPLRIIEAEPVKTELAKALDVFERVVAKTKDAPKRKPGRPEAPKPWVAEGISRSTYLRRKKGATNAVS